MLPARNARETDDVRLMGWLDFYAWVHQYGTKLCVYGVHFCEHDMQGSLDVHNVTQHFMEWPYGHGACLKRDAFSSDGLRCIAEIK